MHDPHADHVHMVLYVATIIGIIWFIYYSVKSNTKK